MPNTGAVRSETVDGVTSLVSQRATPSRVLALVRGPWQLENQSPGVREGTFDEDRSQVRCGNIPQVMAALRKTAIGLLRRAGYANMAAACPGAGACAWDDRGERRGGRDGSYRPHESPPRDHGAGSEDTGFRCHDCPPCAKVGEHAPRARKRSAAPRINLRLPTERSWISPAGTRSPTCSMTLPSASLCPPNARLSCRGRLQGR